MTTLSVVIPAYNEEAGIAEIAKRVLKVRDALQKAGVAQLELIVVDDGSRDRTAEIAAGIAGVQLVRHPTNKGYGAALKTGFAHARGELIGFLDADGTYPPEYFPQLCQAALNGADLVIGSRMAGAASQMPVTRRIGNLFFANLLSLMGRQRVSDSASGMRVFKRSVLARIYPLPDGLNLTPVMSTRAVHEGIQMAEVPIPYSERLGRSKLSVVHDGSLFLRSMVWTVLSYNPVRILGILGMLGIGLAALFFLALLIVRLQGVTDLAAWNVIALFGAATAGTTGVSLFALGITFNYLVALFHQQPVRQGLFGRPLLNTPLDRYFGWLGALALAAGFTIGITSLTLGLNGWDMERLWFYGLISAMAIIVGVQLIVFWVLLRVLDELSVREASTLADLRLQEVSA